MRLFTTALDLVGLAAVVAGVALWSHAAALVTAGVGVLAISYQLAPRPAPPASTFRGSRR